MKKITWQRIKKYFVFLVPVTVILVFLTLELLSRSAAAIFNHAMTEQSMLAGTITAEKIKADIWGNIAFEGLLWQDPEGHQILKIPRGDFKVKLWDIVRGEYRTTTIESLAIYDADISLHLNEKMQVDFVRRSSDFRKMDKLIKDKDKNWRNKVSLANKTEEELKETGRRRREMQLKKADDDLKNFNLDNRNMKLNLLVKDCKLELAHAGRHYLFNRVRAVVKIDTDKEITVGVQADGFGGDAIGHSAMLQGNFNVSGSPTECSVVLRLDKVDPSSLGLGKDLHDPLTLETNFYGTADNIQGTGRLKMDRLNIPGLEFSDVTGKIRYADGKFYFSEVKAKIFDGDFSAYGDYDLDTRYYHINGKGSGLRAEKALPDGELSAAVDLNLSMESQGSPQKTFVEGDFVTGQASYHWWWLVFDRMKGRFTNAYRDLRFYDVEVVYGPYTVQTDGFSIIDKKLRLNPIFLVDGNGNPVVEYDHETRAIKRLK